MDLGGRILSDADTAVRSGQAGEAGELYQRAVDDFGRVIRKVPNAVDALVSRGYALLQLAKPEQALSDLQKAVDLSPAGAVARLALGQYFEQTGDLRSAEHHYRIAARQDPKNAYPHLLLARAQLSSGAAREAAASASAALKADPSNPDGYLLRARARSAAGRIDDALGDVEAAVRLNPDYSDAFLLRALLQGDIGRALSDGGDQDRAREAFGAAVADFDAVLARQPDLTDARTRRAAATAELGNLEEAIDQANVILAGEPGSVDALLLRASCNRSLGREKEALKDYDELVGVVEGSSPTEHAEPRFLDALVEALHRRAELRRMTDTSEAIGDMERAIELMPQRPDLVGQLGILLEASARYDDALKAYERVIALGDTSRDAYRNRADALYLVGRVQDAIRGYGRVLDLDPNDVPALAARSEIRLGLGKADVALDDVNRALRLKPDIPGLHRLRGTIAGVEGRYGDAVADLDRAIKSGDDSADAYAARGDAYAALGNRENAIADYSRAIEVEPSRIELYLARGSASVAQGDQRSVDYALNDFDLALSLDPRRLEGYVGRAEAHLARGHPERAKVDYELVLDLDKANIDALRGLARVLLEVGDSKVDRGNQEAALKAYEKSVATARQAIAVDPKDPYLHYLLAIGLRVIDGWDHAVDAVDAGLRKPGADSPDLRPWLFRERADSLRLWGERRRDTGRLEEALRSVRRGLKGDSGAAAPVLLELAGHILLVLDRTSDAIREFRAALERKDQTADYEPFWSWLGIAKAQILAGRHAAAEKTIRQLEDTVRDRPTLAAWTSVAAALATEPTRPAEAKKQLQESLGKRPRAQQYATRAEMLEYFRAFDHASQDRRKAYELAPDDPAILNALAWFQVEIQPADDLEEARRLSARSVEIEGHGIWRGEYLDTLGWIEFKLGLMALAYDHLKEAVRLKPEDLEKREHLAVVTAARSTKATVSA
jgi:tetratricopeptide (TPR) repeat protein